MLKFKDNIHTALIMFLVGVLFVIAGVVVALMLKTTGDMKEILDDSVRTRLISVAVASREILDVDKFESYNCEEDMENDIDAYTDVLNELRSLQVKVGAEYIYALKEVDGEYIFIFDTDPVTAELFSAYELCQAHIDAFKGQDSADLLNVEDKWGTFNTGSVPIWKDGKVIGVISVDFEDTFLAASDAASRTNAIYLIAALVWIFAAVVVTFIYLLKKVAKAQKDLFKLANYDAVTGLPNRHFLLQYLFDKTSKEPQEKFTLFFIDLDNFKKVNDVAGHDTGDEVLRDVGDYLDKRCTNSKSFRPEPGNVNISARVGGDEFIQVLCGVTTKEDAAKAAQHILDGFSSSPSLSKYIAKYELGLSIGAAIYGEDTFDLHVLIKFADIAMYRVKNSSKGNYAVYLEEMDDKDEK